MTNSHYKCAVLAQFQAALAMLEICMLRCPAKRWDALIGKYPFWPVAYHDLCLVDFYSVREKVSTRLVKHGED